MLLPRSGCRRSDALICSRAGASRGDFSHAMGSEPVWRALCCGDGKRTLQAGGHRHHRNSWFRRCGTTVRNILASPTPYGEVAIGAALAAQAQGLDLVFVNVGTHSVAEASMVTMPNSNIKSVEDLVGKKIAVTSPPLCFRDVVSAGAARERPGRQQDHPAWRPAVTCLVSRCSKMAAWRLRC